MKKNLKFTLIEIIVAMGIFAIAVTGVLSLISTSINISSNVVGKNYSSIAANIFIENIRSLVNSKDEDKEYWKGFIQEDETHLPEEEFFIPIKDDIGTDSGVNDDWFTEDSNHSISFDNLVITPNKNKPGIYKIALKTEVEDGVFATDFEGICRVWKSPISISFFNGTGTENSEDSNYDIFCRLNIEVSWPIQKEYSTRYSKVYFFDVQKGEL